MNENEPNAKYNGYGSCPLFTGDKKLMLLEFKYGGTGEETFLEDQTVPRNAFYHLKKEGMPYVYWNYVAKGRWFGHDMFSQPKFA